MKSATYFNFSNMSCSGALAAGTLGSFTAGKLGFSASSGSSGMGPSLS
jgi:hypothetical protein